MKIVSINMHTPGKSKDLLDILSRENLEAGDRLKIVLSEDDSELITIAVILLVILTLEEFFNKNQGDAIINQIFGKYQSASELESAIKKEYNIDLEIIGSGDLIKERKAWMRTGMEYLEKKYDDEEDIASLKVSEPNPKFKLND